MWWSLLLMLLAALFLELENRYSVGGICGGLCLLCFLASVFYAFAYVENGIYIIGFVVFCLVAFLIWRFF